MNNLGDPVLSRSTIYLSGGHCNGYQTDKNQFLVVVDGNAPRQLMLEAINKGNSNSTIYVKVSTTTSEQPSVDPFLTESGSGFSGTFSSQSNHTVVPGGVLKWNESVASGVTYLLISNVGSPTILNIESTKQLEILT
jgi:hypothetical protein